MNVQQLRVLQKAASCRTVTEAAAELGLKQPTVSFHLRKLEEAFGVELFRKQAGRLALTDAGEGLLPYARKITALVEEAEQLMKEYREEGRGKLRIGASYTPATYFLPAYLAEFQQRFPNALPLLTVKQAGGALAMLHGYEVDVAIVSLPDEPYPDLNVVKLTDDELKLALSPRHPLASRKKISIEDLRREPFLVHETGSTSRELSESWAKENGLQWHIRMELGAIETIKESVKHGIGIGILPWRSFLKEAGAGELVMRDLPGHVRRRTISLAFRKEEALVPQASQFISFMRSKLEV
ncbi:LysR family transcriptional regulator [Cohnella xylanilytica]|uniref:LysR family transcriptional regulator n=1 Tax=Cohnella xylanilytica TaxID=557555 RepID=A0A841U088_9BACL|nr:LysR family transcriptional regulator [Cohnella xylanilytica]MBB6693229.1 LysR family transcriptional regulator [Cohnella xylanilytica]